MTGDVEEECSLLQISHLESPISSAANVSITQPITSTSLINSRMTIENNCIYTAAISSDLVGSLPEGTVLQIMPDSTIVALAVKNLPTSNGSSIIFKDSSFSIESNQNTLNLPNLLTETADNEQQSVDVPVCSEENMSDIDLSFLNETEENNTIADPKCLNENAVTELQGMIADVSPHSLNLLQSNLNLSDSNAKSSLEQVNSEPTKNSNANPGDVVMIDVSKPIQLSQNSLIMVNGQKCILQQDPQTGQVIAYPVKEQDKPRRKRGRPRKASLEQTTKEMNSAENASVRDMESLSEEEREKGLLEIVNDDGALVRRSSRKRKKAKVLRDYETGNLKQELGSDVDDIEILDKDVESSTRRKKVRGPGRPRKYIKTVNNVLDDNANNASGEKRQRGRPKKIVAENEQTQAFLVHTADGQVLMMQVPLSSIPPGITLQEMAQEIANKLNLGINQTNKVPVLNEKGTSIKDLHTESDEETIGNIPEVAKSVPELALQDHSIGSTTNFNSIQAELNHADENSDIIDSSCQDMLNNMNEIIGDPVCESEEVILESENCVKNSIIPENISEDQNKLNDLEVSHCSEDNFCINIQSATNPIDSTSMLCNLDNSLIDHDFGLRTVPKSLKENCKHIQVGEISKVSKELFVKSDILKDKVNLQLILDTESEINPDLQNINIEELLNKNVNSDRLILSPNKFKHLNMTYITNLIDNEKPCTEKQYIIQQFSNIVSSDQVTKNAFKSVVAESKANMDKVCLQSESVIENVECNNAINSKCLSSPQSAEVESSDKFTSQFMKSDAMNSKNHELESILPLQKVSLPESSIPNENTIVSSTSTAEPKKVLPMFIPVQTLEESKNCKICQIPYFTDEEIIEHFKVKHPKCICTECNYMNEHPYVIKRHAFRHTNHGCICKICNKNYKDLYILKMHIKMVHLPPDILYACEICEKKFTRKAHLKRHLRIHAPIKQYQCPHCDYKGCEKSDITKHLLIHEEPKFKCEICSKTFRHAKNKELHLKRHSGQRDYKCAACGFFGYTYTDIRKHIERRHSLACSHCKQVFTDVEFLKEHKRVGTCQPNLLEENKNVKIEGSSNVTVDDKETALLDEMPLDLLETHQPQAMIISECSEGILNTQNDQLIVEDLEDNIIISNNLPVLSVEKDSSKMITLVRTNGRHLSLKNCSSLPLECIATVSENGISEPFILTNESEPVS